MGKWYCFRDDRYLGDEEAKVCGNKEASNGERC